MTRCYVQAPHRLTRELDQMVDSVFGRQGQRTQSQFTPAIDIIENSEEYRLVMALPGIGKEDVKITVKNELLTISGRRKQSELRENARLLRSEIVTGDFERSFTISEKIQPDKISAEFSAGLLSIRLPKAEEVKPKEIEVRIG